MLTSAYLRVSITDRCNLRCVYCLPEAARFAVQRAAPPEIMHLAELIAQVIEVRKIRITGGEPTIAPAVVEHVRHARRLAREVGMTTNGVALAPLLPALQEAGLTRLNISLDAVDPEAFRRFSRRDGLPQVIAAIRLAQRLGFRPLKVNAVAMQGTDVSSLVRFATWEGVHLRFIELMPIGEARSLTAQYRSAADIRERLASDGIVLSERTDRDEPTSRVWSIAGHAVEDCSVGFITTMSAPFCATCDRLRLSSQGRLFTCLMDNQGVDLLTMARSGDEQGVRRAISSAIGAKRPPTSFIRHEVMASIGG